LDEGRRGHGRSFGEVPHTPAVPAWPSFTRYQRVV
jgi:hypothetical protein